MNLKTVVKREKKKKKNPENRTFFIPCYAHVRVLIMGYHGVRNNRFSENSACFAVL